MNAFFSSESFSAAMTAALDYAPYGGADISECLQAMERIRDGDRESWHLAWIELADTVRRRATQNLTGGHKTEAGNAFLRVAHYYRIASCFLQKESPDPRIATTREASGACFTTAMRLSVSACETARVEHKGTRHTAYLHRATNEPRPRATVLVVGEVGATPLELYFSCATAVNQCGWHCLAVSGGDEADTDSKTFAESLLKVAVGLASVDPECLALLLFREEPAPPLDAYCRRLAYPWAMGSADMVKKVLHQKQKIEEPAEAVPYGFNTSGTLSQFHQHLFRWINGAE
jgi:hypothetical protein